MNTLDALNEYLRKVERALGLLALSRGAAAVAGVALAATVALALIIARAMLTTGGLVVARAALFIAVAPPSRSLSSSRLPVSTDGTRQSEPSALTPSLNSGC